MNAVLEKLMKYLPPITLLKIFKISDKEYDTACMYPLPGRSDMTLEGTRSHSGHHSEDTCRSCSGGCCHRYHHWNGYKLTRGGKEERRRKRKYEVMNGRKKKEKTERRGGGRERRDGREREQGDEGRGIEEGKEER